MANDVSEVFQTGKTCYTTHILSALAQTLQERDFADKAHKATIVMAVNTIKRSGRVGQGDFTVYGLNG